MKFIRKTRVHTSITNKMNLESTNLNESTSTDCSKTGVSGSVFLEIGMRVKIKMLSNVYFFNAGKTKTITSNLENFGSLRAFGLDGDDGIWCIEDFDFCVDYPMLGMR